MDNDDESKIKVYNIDKISGKLPPELEQILRMFNFKVFDKQFTDFVDLSPKSNVISVDFFNKKKIQ